MMSPMPSLFGKRRAYQRKVAVSHFDGIASAHSMILRANEKNAEMENISVTRVLFAQERKTKKINRGV